MNLRGFLFLSAILICALSLSVEISGKTFNQSDSEKESLRQDAPLTLAQILTGLQTQGKTAETRTLAARNKFIAARVRERGVGFELTDEREQDLRDAGASDELIDAIRSVSKSKPKNEEVKTQTIPTPTYDRNLARTHTDKCNSYLDSKNYDAAITECTRAIEADPTYSNPYSDRGNAYRDKGELERAMADYNKAIELDAGNSIAYNNRGLTYNLKNEPERALVDFNKTIELNPYYSHPYHNRGVYYLNKGEYDKGIAEFSRAIELNPQQFQSYLGRGNCYLNKGDQNRAIDDYTRAIEISPTYALAYKNRAIAYDNKGDSKRARADREAYDRLIRGQ